jgi:hypothetical protein
MDPFPGAARAPTPEVAVHGLPVRHIVRQQPPSASGADQVQDCVQNRQAIMFHGAPSKYGRRPQPLDSFPLSVAQIAGIAGPLHALAIAHPGQTSTFQTRSQAPGSGSGSMHHFLKDKFHCNFRGVAIANKKLLMSSFAAVMCFRTSQSGGTAAVYRANIAP